MRLFFKHLLRSIRWRPLQPIILVLTIALSVAIMACAISLEARLGEEIEIGNRMEYGDANLVVTLGSESTSRFMFEDEAREILGKGAEVAGIYELLLSFGGDSFFSAAPDFLTVNGIFDFAFTESMAIPDTELSRAVVVTEELADKNSLALGDKIELTILSDTREYSVYAISKTPLLGKYELMVDIRAAVGAMAQSSPLASVIGEDFKPCSKLYISVNDGYSVTEARNLLAGNENFYGKSFDTLSASSYSDMSSVVLSVIIKVCVALTSVLAAVIIFCCFYIISAERTEENYSFYLAGARQTHLAILQYSEALIYWIIGVPIGILLSYPILGVIMNYAGFRFASQKVAQSAYPIASLALLFVALITVAIFRASYGRERALKQVSRVYIFILILAFAVLCVLMTVFGGDFGFFSGFFAMIILFMILATVSVIFFVKCAKGADRLRENRILKNGILPSASLGYAVKNLISLRVLRNAARLISMIATILLGASVVVASANGNVKITESYFTLDHAVLNPTERCIDRLLECESAVRVEKVYKSTSVYENGIRMHVISCADTDCLNDWIRIDELPQGDSALISDGAARMLGIREGDKINVSIDNRMLELHVTGLIKSGVSTLVFDADYFGITHNMLLVDLDKENESASLAEISSIASAELAAVVPIDDLMGGILGVLKLSYRCAYGLLYAVTLFALFGFIDNIYESYRSREEEFRLYENAGMSKKTIAKMKLIELLLTLLFGILLGALFAIAVVLVLHTAILKYGYDVLYNFCAFFGL